RMLRAWQGPDRDRRDFFLGNVSLEVKIGLQRLRHHFSLDQVQHPAGDAASYVISLWATKDPTGGTSLRELIERIDRIVDDPIDFETRLMRTGFSRQDLSAYDHRFSVLEPPTVFPTGSIPTVRAADPGVSAIRYVAELSLENAL